MPGRSYYKKRYSRYKKRYRRAKRLYAPVRPEIKTCDTWLAAGTGVGTGGTMVLLNGLVEGPGFNQRVGRSCQMKSLQCVLHWDQSTVSVANAANFQGRFMIIYDRQANGAMPALSDILLGTSATGTTITDVQTFTNPNNFSRFRILASEEILLPGVGAGGTQAATCFSQTDPMQGGKTAASMSQRFWKLKGLPVMYKGATSAIGDIASGSLIAVFLSNYAAAGYFVTYSFRLRFYD